MTTSFRDREGSLVQLGHLMSIYSYSRDCPRQKTLLSNFAVHKYSQIGEIRLKVAKAKNQKRKKRVVKISLHSSYNFQLFIGCE